MHTVITLYSFSVQFETKDRKLKQHVEDFIAKYYTLITPGFGFNQPPKIDVYVGYVKDFDMWYFHTRQFNHLRWYLDTMGYPLKDYEVVDNRELKKHKQPYKVRSSFKLRENQKPILDFIMDGKTKRKLLPLATGSGKTVIAMNAMARMGRTFSLLITPTFSGKWKGDIVTILEMTEDQIFEIRGGSNIDKTLALVETYGKTDYQAYIISLPTFRSFVTAFETSPQLCIDEKGIAPIDFFPTVGIDTLVIDETHMSFLSVFKCLLYAHIDFILGLSATLIPSTPFEKRIYETLYKGDEIYHDKMIKQYMKVFPMFYTIDRDILNKLSWTRGGKRRDTGAYAHYVYEKSIMKDKRILKGYLNLIDETLRAFYFDQYLPKDKCIIFVTSISFATKLTEWLQAKYPDKILRRYCEDDVYEDMLEGDIIVSTVGSAGTGLDIPNLRVGIQTVSVSSEVSNIQTAGRLRELKDRDVKFIYFVCDQIKKQINHHKQRCLIFKDRSQSITPIRSDIGLRFG